jgi:hypothetical protein
MGVASGRDSAGLAVGAPHRLQNFTPEAKGCPHEEQNAAIFHLLKYRFSTGVNYCVIFICGFYPGNSFTSETNKRNAMPFFAAC